ncbi:MAG: hypothetical protein OHM56_12280 [Spiroplasma phoeniceum]|nr:MAG: hypothetical protein OHM57_11715 [Spiroplasma phoeniceum]UZQ32288.1 MAG: hypothetical protein OHM56_12280 [Spiroplasma phoeniceum]
MVFFYFDLSIQIIIKEIIKVIKGNIVNTNPILDIFNLGISIFISNFGLLVATNIPWIPFVNKGVSKIAIPLPQY